MKISLDKDWEKNIYSKGKHLNLYPYDLVVSIVARKFFNIPAGKRKKIRVLDLGCGAGNNSKFLAENGFNVYGIDGSKSAIKICRERFKKWNLSAEFIQGDFVKLPYRNNFFDLIVDRESLYANSFNSILNIINEVYKKLKTNGLFISFIFNTFHHQIHLGQKIEKNTYGDFKKGSYFYKAGIAHFTNLKEVSEIFADFKIENIIRHSLIESYNKKSPFIESDEYIIVARKIK
jgi:ubiquinone/menaquinone biosynthesis C-methylase UbiE